MSRKSCFFNIVGLMLATTLNGLRTMFGGIEIRMPPGDGLRRDKDALYLDRKRAADRVRMRT
jgi:hypothetical protein